MTRKTNNAMDSLRSSFTGRKHKQLAMKEMHEKLNNLGMAYLATWSILESFAKEVAPLCRRAELRALLDGWLHFLDGNGSGNPKIISSGKFQIDKKESDKIPTESILKILIDADLARNFYEVIDADKKYRKRRNVIAHSGEEPSRNVYDEFNQKALASISEIENWLMTVVSH